jgi:hypothetical protein
LISRLLAKAESEFIFAVGISMKPLYVQIFLRIATVVSIGPPLPKVL